MVLDLIANGKMSWKAALTNEDDTESGGSMPMSMKGALMAARSLHNNYNSFVPTLIRYKYDCNKYEPNAKIKELVEKEFKIIFKWLEWRYKEKFGKEFEQNSVIDDDEMRKAVALTNELVSLTEKD